MLTLTTPITVPNLTRLRVRRVEFDEDTSVAYVHVEAVGPGGAPPVYPGSPFVLEIRNGNSIGLRATASPASFTDRVQQFTIATPTGFTALVAAYVGATVAARNRGAETAGVAAGWLPGGSVA